MLTICSLAADHVDHLLQRLEPASEYTHTRALRCKRQRKRPTQARSASGDDADAVVEGVRHEPTNSGGCLPVNAARPSSKSTVRANSSCSRVSSSIWCSRCG